eukprot:TRINITY_DN23683_c0_g1_i1.p1 TRINITY_DN23683_c0_g1~~TRINITY_DN23683_c0_g1_i1.p1  ORF type:complete len:596 (+),score=111.70 TRINITY_DN23683_c0_g1_i1:88-1875(+)
MEVSWSNLLSESYDVLWKMIIRPPRSQYKIEDLGPTRFRIGKRGFCRKDLQLQNDRGLRLECSHFSPNSAKTEPLPCVVYLHGNCSSRLEALEVMQVLLPKDIMVFAVDLAGSGHSEGEYISLGHYEQQDLRVVVQHLREVMGVKAIGLWGRSMGAATSVLRAAEDWNLSAVVMDSPFSSLPVVAQELVNSQIAVPDFILKMALESVRKEIKARAKFDIEDLQPINRAPRARSPALFAVAKDDDFVLPHHTYDLHNAWGANIKKLVTFEGGHNGSRPRWFLDEGVDFLESHLKAPTTTDTRSTSQLHGESFVPAPLNEGHFPAPLPDSPKATGKVPQKTSASQNDLQQKPPVAASSGSTAASLRQAVPAFASTGSSAASLRQVRQPAPAASDHAKSSEIAAQLISMGFSKDIAAEAATRCPTVEAAVDWTIEESSKIAKESAQALGQLNQKLRAPDSNSTQIIRGVSPEVEAAQAAAGEALRRELSKLSALSSCLGSSMTRQPATAPLTNVASVPSHAISPQKRPAVSATGYPAAYQTGADPESVPDASDMGSVRVLVAQLADLGFPERLAHEAARRSSTVEGAVAWLTDYHSER